MARTKKSLNGVGGSKEEIVAAALGLVAEHGVDKLTMRQLSARLGVAPMSLYWYVPNKDILLDLLCDEVIASVPESPVARKRWDRALFVIARETWLALRRYPGLAAVAIERLPNEHSPNALRLLDLSTSLLREAGYDDAGAARAALTAYLFVVAHVQFGARTAGLYNSPESVPFDTVASDPDAHHPWFAAMAAAPEDLLVLFEYGFQRLLDGFRLELSGRSRNPSRSTSAQLRQ